VIEQPAFEAIVSGEFSDAAVAQYNPDLYADVIDVFLLLDPIAITDAVMTDREADAVRVVQALGDAFGDVPYPYADEDDL
jgi:hypothetical protein